MNRYKLNITIILLFFLAGIFSFSKKQPKEDARFITYIADPKKQDIKMFWKDDNNKNFGSIQNLNLWLVQNNQRLVFAMNGGMYKPDRSPQGLFIAKQKTLALLDTANGIGNFYLQPNGVFYLSADNIAVICKTKVFKNNGQIKYATQSGPMLVYDGEINSLFKSGSGNVNIRNGVGILPGNKIIFAMSESEINFYDFANYFKSLGCKNALYLDGLVSRTYYPEKEWLQTDGNFGVIIGVTTSRNR